MAVVCVGVCAWEGGGEGEGGEEGGRGGSVCEWEREEGGGSDAVLMTGVYPYPITSMHRISVPGHLGVRLPATLAPKISFRSWFWPWSSS